MSDQPLRYHLNTLPPHIIVAPPTGLAHLGTVPLGADWRWAVRLKGGVSLSGMGPGEIRYHGIYVQAYDGFDGIERAKISVRPLRKGAITYLVEVHGKDGSQVVVTGDDMAVEWEKVEP